MLSVGRVSELDVGSVPPRLIETPTAGKSASLTFRLVLRASQPITMSKMFLAASAMPWMGSTVGGCMVRSIGEAVAEPL